MKQDASYYIYKIINSTKYQLMNLRINIINLHSCIIWLEIILVTRVQDTAKKWQNQLPSLEKFSTSLKKCHNQVLNNFDKFYASFEKIPPPLRLKKKFVVLNYRLHFLRFLE